MPPLKPKPPVPAAPAAPAVPSPIKNGREQLAVNVFDLDRLEPSVRALMLAGKLDGSLIRIDPERPDEAGAVLSCDLLAAACLLDVIRSQDRKAGDYPTRVYLKKRTWSRIPSDAILTLLVDGTLMLNPAYFGVHLAPIPPKAATRVIMG